MIVSNIKSLQKNKVKALGLTMDALSLQVLPLHILT